MSLFKVSQNNYPPILTTCIKRYGLIALAMDDFFQKLQKDSKSTAYPASRINELLTKDECRN
ncbi:MAG: hypothetical protein P4L79_16505 [Legionella sp.]|uniref:hypothetical protein n=1 Tax=Legionella sp. TaxID=459 RepID=UPI002851788B|nr:hypothetical protein [Legionella sp.]